MFEEFGANDLSLKELEDLWSDNEQSENSPQTDDVTNPDSSDEQSKKDVSQTKAFAKRLAEEKAKVVNEERENIAKSLGYNSYAELQKSKERKLYEDRGLDHDEVAPLVDELVKQKLDADPRMKELENFKSKQVEEFAKRELAEITKLTDGEVTKIEQLPKEVMEEWKKCGSLKKAYINIKGEELIVKAKSERNKGSTQHLNNPSPGSNKSDGTRPLTSEEKKMWKFFNPKLTDEELNNKRVNK